MKLNKKLRIAILIRDENIASWAYDMLSKISSDTEVILLVKTNATKTNTTKSFVHSWFKKFDRKEFKLNPDAFELKNINSLLNVDVINNDDLTQLRNYDLDIIINLEMNFDKTLFKYAKYGVWSFYHNNSVPVFWEVINKSPKIDVILQMELENVKKVLAVSSTLTDNISVARSENNYYWKASAMLSRTINQLHKLGPTLFFEKKSKYDSFLTNYTNSKKQLKNINVLIGVMKFEFRRIRNIIRSFFYFDQWALLFSLDDTSFLSENFNDFKKILPPKDRFWADPHIYKKDNIYYIFIEELIYKENKGFISVIEMDEKGNYKQPVKILEKDYHLSFPFIIEDNNEVFMIPESKESGQLELYKCVDFPYKWKLETVLMNKKAVDTVIVKREDEYWLFSNMTDVEGASFNDELYLFSSDTLTSKKWTPHPENPIISDVTNARLAGNLVYNDNNELFRVAQNCSHHYGYGMQINNITTINDTVYEEEKIKEIHPKWSKNISSTHSYSKVDKLTVIDAQIRRRK